MLTLNVRGLPRNMTEKALTELFEAFGKVRGLKMAKDLFSGECKGFAEVQMEGKKLARQFQYADKAGIRFVVLYGEDEAARNVVTVKDLRAKEQFEVARDDLARTLRVEIEQQRAMGGV